MNFRPIDNYLRIACSNIKTCTKCGMRIGCPIRHMFYTMPEEIMFSKLLYGADDFSERKEEFVIKRKTERKLYPEYSYK